ncbi:MAG: hypothetical protein CSA79_00320 [Thiothrix nivea]|nr:MAG: hypothetical protein CSA79_00320 [Thiothrix nivea]
MSVANPFTVELVLKPLPSRWLLGFVAVIHFGTLVVLWFLPGLSLWVALLLSVAIVGSLLFHLLLHSGCLPKRWVATLYWRQSGGWELTTASGEHLPVIFSDSSFSSVLVDVLNFTTRPALGRRRFTVILLPDNSDARQRRYLRMRLHIRQEVNPNQ